jgi:hypothetical protein
MEAHPHSIPFTYSTTQFDSCAKHLLPNSPSSNLDDCRELFIQHAVHYKRDSLSDEEERFWKSHREDGGEVPVSPSRRIEAFLESVKFVYLHNSEGRHEVALNRFSDLTVEELPLVPAAAEGSESTYNNSSLHWLDELQQPSSFLPLDSEEIIRKLGERLRPKSTRQSPFRHLFHRNFLGIFDSWWWIGDRHDDTDPSTQRMEKHSHRSSIDHSSSNQKSFVVDKDNERNGIEDPNDDEGGNDRWERYLNWATSDNPDGVGIVHEAMDQVSLFESVYFCVISFG